MWYTEKHNGYRRWIPGLVEELTKHALVIRFVYVFHSFSDTIGEEREICNAPWVMRKKNMIVSRVILGTKSYCAGEDQKQFTGCDTINSSNCTIYRQMV
jgi:hypothetical protein